MCKVDQVTFVSTGKSIVTKCFFGSAYSAGRNVFSCAGMVDQIVSLNFYIVNISCIKADNASFYRNDNIMRVAFFQFSDSLADTLCKCKVGDGFQNIIHSTYFISLYGVLGHICNENDEYTGINISNFLSGSHTIDKFHLNIHQDNVFGGDFVSVMIYGYSYFFVGISLIFL